MTLGHAHFGYFTLWLCSLLGLLFILTGPVWGQEREDAGQRGDKHAEERVAADKPAGEDAGLERDVTAVDPPKRDDDPVGWWIGLAVLVGLIVFSGVVAMQPKERELEEKALAVSACGGVAGGKVAVFGDIHGNLQALEAVLSDIKQRGVSSCVCTGDLVGYGANPNECVQMIRDLGCPAVLGNHDHHCTSAEPLDKFNFVAAMSVLWTRDNLEEEHKEYLRKLPLVCEGENFTVVHADLSSPQDWSYVLDDETARTMFEDMRKPVCFIGHSHSPLAYVMDGAGKISVGPIGDERIESSGKYIVNVGSVGQARDGNPAAAYVLFDVESLSVELVRVEYDVEAAQEAILRVDLPPRNARRLSGSV
ncbi:MAG: metallophosphoesterase family protein [Lentisphaeria bacterium]|nr:metallophosphoesterase family protein [Lentisphaeria bacterium]